MELKHLGRVSFSRLISSASLLLFFGGGIFASAQSSRPGWGSTPHHTNGAYGVTFRVWVPDATSVFVPGQFNSWSTTATTLAKELTNGVWNGNWSADVASATNGQQYKYYLNFSGGNNFISGTGVWRHDPRARMEVSSSTGFSNTGSNIVSVAGAAANVSLGAYAVQIFSQQPFTPTMSIAQSNCVAVISWPLNFSNWTLQSATDLGGNWTAANAFALQTNGGNVAAAVPSGGAVFYRLQKP